MDPGTDSVVPVAAGTATPRDADPDIVSALAHRFAAAGVPTRIVRTHISWVLLAGDRAWKLKRPVRFGFLDFSTPELRRHACEEEVRLNRRLVPSLYLGVVPVRAAPDGPSLEGAGEPIDWAVAMRRLPDGAIASERLAAGTLAPSHLAALARRLAVFHREAPVAPPDSPYGRPVGIRDDALRALDALAPLADAATCARLRARLDALAVTLAPRWEARRRAGRIREGHGDLHLDNVLIGDDGVTAFDCIEFDASLRWIDTASDLAFPIADLLARGRDDLAWGFLDDCLQADGDVDGLDVLRFYVAYRAIVRALVGVLRERDGSGGQAPAPARWLEVALRVTDPPSPRLAITHGLPGSGKSVIARALLERTGAVRLRSDVERKRMAGLDALDDSRAAGDLYGAQAGRATYARLAALAGSALRAGWPTIVDAACLHRSQRDAYRALATTLGVPFTILDCDAPLPVLHRRVAARRARGDDPSEADASVLDRLAASREPLAADERASAIAVCTDEPLDADGLAARWMAIR